MNSCSKKLQKNDNPPPQIPSPNVTEYTTKMTEHKLVFSSRNLILMLSTFSDLYYEICGWILVTQSFIVSSSTIILTIMLKESVIKQLQDKPEFVWSELFKYVLLLTSVSYTKLVFLLLFWEDLQDKKKAYIFLGYALQ